MAALQHSASRQYWLEYIDADLAAEHLVADDQARRRVYHPFALVLRHGS